MAKKDFDREYAQMERDYLDMVAELKDMEKELGDGLVSPDMYESMKETAAALLANYRVWNYIKFVLDKPARKEKQARYTSQNKKLLDNCKTFKQAHQENIEVLQEMRRETEE